MPHAIGGDLGAFWSSEMTRPDPDGPLAVGPVPMTTPELPVSLTIAMHGEAFPEVEAVTGSGHHYTFTAALHPNR